MAASYRTCPTAEELDFQNPPTSIDVAALDATGQRAISRLGMLVVATATISAVAVVAKGTAVPNTEVESVLRSSPADPNTADVVEVIAYRPGYGPLSLGTRTHYGGWDHIVEPGAEVNFEVINAVVGNTYEVSLVSKESKERIRGTAPFVCSCALIVDDGTCTCAHACMLMQHTRAQWEVEEILLTFEPFTQAPDIIAEIQSHTSGQLPTVPHAHNTGSTTQFVFTDTNKYYRVSMTEYLPSPSGSDDDATVVRKYTSSATTTKRIRREIRDITDEDRDRVGWIRVGCLRVVQLAQARPVHLLIESTTPRSPSSHTCSTLTPW